MVYLYDGILFSYEEKQSTNISCNMNELGNMMLNERRQKKSRKGKKRKDKFSASREFINFVGKITQIHIKR